MATIQPTISLRELTSELERLAAVFGAAHKGDKGMQALMVREWYLALGGYRFPQVRAAVSKLITTSKWWPHVSELITEISSHDRPGLPAFREQFEEPRTPAEVERRAAIVALLKAKHAYQPAKTGNFETEDRPVKPASREQWVSPQLRNSCVARRARGQSTCESNCDLAPGSKNCQFTSERVLN